MRAISILRDITMRVLIVSALFACAAAAPAPSLLAPLPFAAVALPRIIVAPTIPPGDLQAAAIDAQVKISDQAQLLADQARELAEQAAENQNEGVAEANDLTKEKSEEAFWAAEELKYQAMNEAQIAEARNAALLAEKSAALVKSDDVSAMAPGVESGSQSGVAVEAASTVEAKPEAAVKSQAVSELKDEKEAIVKTAEEKPAEKAEGEKKEDLLASAKSALDEALKAQNLAIQAYNSAFIPSGVAIASYPAGYPAGVAVVPSAAVGYQSLAPFSYQAAYRSFPIHV